MNFLTARPAGQRSRRAFSALSLLLACTLLPVSAVPDAQAEPNAPGGGTRHGPRGGVGSSIGVGIGVGIGTAIIQRAITSSPQPGQRSTTGPKSTKSKAVRARDDVRQSKKSRPRIRSGRESRTPKRRRPQSLKGSRPRR